MTYLAMSTVPRDGSPVLLKPRTGSDLKHPFVGRFYTGSEDWGFAAPVGFGGIDEASIEGWLPLPQNGGTAACAWSGCPHGAECVHAQPAKGA